MLRIGVIGYGYWGPNIVRNFHQADGAEVVAVCDLSSDLLRRAHKAYPHLRLSQDIQDIITAPDIDVVAVITPVSTHYELAKAALLNGKHVFIEKPFTASAAQGEELIEIAEKRGLTIMVDHTFLFTGAVRKIHELIRNGSLGKPLYYDSTRVNLGLFQNDVNVIWDLGPHDFSIMDYLVDEKPVAISALGKAHFGSSYEDMAFVTVCFDNDMIAHFNFNWLSPVKIRRTLIGCQHKMLVWNDLIMDEKIRLYDKGVDVQSQEGMFQLLVQYRTGDMSAPRVDNTEALALETQYFVDCVTRQHTPINDGHAGLRIVRMLEATSESIRQNGRMISL